MIRADVGPTLPALLRRRFGVPPVVTLAAAAAVAAVVIGLIVWVLTRPPGTGIQVVHERDPVFNMLHAPALHRAKVHEGELMRLQGRRGQLTVEVVVRPLELPSYEGDVTHGLLPAYANGFIETQRRDGLTLTQEGRARVNNAVGYEVGFERVVPGETRTFARDVLLVPDDPEESGGGFVTLSLRQVKPGGAKLTPRERNLAYLSRKAYRSFRYGTQRG